MQERKDGLLMGESQYKPILSLDFDGVIHSYTSGWQGADIVSDPPVLGAFEFIKDALDYFEVCIYSTRSRQAGGIVAMQNWFIENGWEGTLLTGPEYLSFPTEKLPSFLTIDDRAITFTGTFPSPKELLEFKPWNK